LVGVVRITYPLSMAEITSGSSFEPNSPTKPKQPREGNLDPKELIKLVMLAV